MRAEFKRLFRKKSFYILSLISLSLLITWLISTYYAGMEGMNQGIVYDDTQLTLLEPQRVFQQGMTQITLSIYIFPFIIMGVIMVYDDIKEKTILQIAVISDNKYKYYIQKYLVLLVYNFIMLLMFWIICIFFSFTVPEIRIDMWKQLFSIYNALSFIIFWLGISFWGMVAMTITCITKSGIGGSCVAIYILFERIFTGTTAITFHNQTLMKINEFLPWTNFNTLFVYAGNIQYLLSDLSETEKLQNASVLTMYKIIEYNGTFVPYPFFKNIEEIIGICILFFLSVTAIYLYSYNQIIHKL